MKVAVGAFSVIVKIQTSRRLVSSSSWLLYCVLLLMMIFKLSNISAQVSRVWAPSPVSRVTRPENWQLGLQLTAGHGVAAPVKLGKTSTGPISGQLTKHGRTYLCFHRECLLFIKHQWFVCCMLHTHHTWIKTHQV